MPQQVFDESLLKFLIQGVKDYAIFALDPDGHVATWNMGAQRINGYRAEEIAGKHFSTFYTQEARERQHPQFELRTALSDGSYEEEGWRVRKDGTLFWANVIITTLYDDDGKHIGFASVTRDLSERKAALQSNHESTIAVFAAEDAFNSMVAAVKDYAIFVLDPVGNVRTWNTGAERIKGYTAEEIIGKHFSIFYTESAKAINHPRFELDEARTNGSYEEQGWRIRKDGSQFWASVTITRMTGANGITSGFLKVTRDLTEYKLNESALETARDEAILANDMKSRFVANVTHEIRTPLSGIVGLSQLITEDEHENEKTREIGSRIFDASKQLLAILNDLLDFSRLEAGKVAVEHKPYDLRAVLDEIVGLLSPQSEKKCIALTANIEDTVPPDLVGDENKIRQVLMNLVHNAIKFTARGGVEISVERAGDSLLFSVTDTGVGIADNLQHTLFRPFVQAEETTARVYGGTGLGLSISQQYVELMKGEIGLSSKPGQGTTAWFSLPLESTDVQV